MVTKNKWKIIDTEYIIRRPWLTARRDRVELPDGRINNEFYILEYPTWVNVIAITDKNAFVMVEQYRHGLDDTFIELCAGVAEEGEEPIEAAKRELLEETGFAGGNWKLLNVIAQNPSTCTNYTYCFLAEGVTKVASQSLDATEDLTVKLMSEAEVLSLLTKDKMKQALMATPLWHYFAGKYMSLPFNI